MFVRKKTKLRIAYGLLAITALSVVAYDADGRRDLRFQSTQAERALSREPAAPLPITPLAQSPFLDARPGAAIAGKSDIARNASQPAPSGETLAAPSGFYFLKVAVQVDSGGGPVSFNRGTRVRFVRQQDGKFLVTRNGTDFLIEESQVKEDLTALAKFARNSS